AEIVKHFAQVDGVSEALVVRIEQEALDHSRPSLAAQKGDQGRAIQHIGHGDAASRFSWILLSTPPERRFSHSMSSYLRWRNSSTLPGTWAMEPRAARMRAARSSGVKAGAAGESVAMSVVVVVPRNASRSPSRMRHSLPSFRPANLPVRSHSCTV